MSSTRWVVTGTCMAVLACSGKAPDSPIEDEDVPLPTERATTTRGEGTTPTSSPTDAGSALADAGSEGATDAGKTKPNKPYGSPCDRGECAPSLSCLPTTEEKFSAICSVWCIHDRDCPKKSRCGRLYVCLPD